MTHARIAGQKKGDGEKSPDHAAPIEQERATQAEL
jgi:hypothetical protein